MALRDDRRNYVVVGAFVLAMGAALIVWLSLLAHRTGETESYVVHYHNVLGLGEGTQVYFEGHPAGVIESITWRPEQERFEVELAVGASWRIPRASVAQITASGLLSAFLIDIQVPDAPLAASGDALGPGDEIQGGELINVFELLGATAGELNRLMMEDLGPLVATLTSGTPEVMDDVKTLTDDLRKAVARVSGLLSQDNAASVERTLAHLETTSESFARTSHDLGETRARLDELLLSLHGLLDQEQGEVAHAVTDLHRSLRQNPGLLLRGRDVEDVGSAP
jgi:phospholipid/cholesterol/gamma-HCH transport system substrate-binding protein